ncbi:MAG: leucyl/phenylalanyl-tRNA--protein transferase [Candidatus Dactylopiibacterium carminicum]|uniref:Leucyl/phenylalanyl-tRNA--protein transferase n=1 Tax=Candidatus Dactylopiibacterium carminicum TaxID=857335 RepID=A0A272EZ16_9RHOO|nr:leucyl/phenylalanyl-tRNA--protein transferase [Candidatus Dactylopiibacterium carminicum]KAF7600863.1 leucyl/phenylalanyl-tRNA--protein transferase [Candidatus Dactylopiibacterium carminicum]PAS95362.1 MAG: leucyl/phenylalanyl-tRNA--protein transferase [Candidatus Dactylopiibacterium carminicum]PAS98627.1 MAG: leucyl/phenylalanyl-tRNA--protein transferase [Candidatus Dactylopiibacterium carminicum]PAT00865.1 MAG: leucyl/phenylalanyl-tRNA--protein transferase [Candidatus Dactylopiibacterium c
MIPWLTEQPVFPSPSRALREPAGLLAAGGRLTPEWLLNAYRQGIFPWFSEGDPILWWSPDPRMVLRPGAVRISHSLRKTLRASHYEIRCDTAFAEVMAACAAPRDGQAGTWILPEMRAAYVRLHELGWAHSVETWMDGELVGGLYGVAIGRAFFGESMFHRVRDASKIAFAHLAALLQDRNYAILDCQMSTAHLASLGAAEMSRSQFVAELAALCVEGPVPARWPVDHACREWRD